jgi:hypothetical protein
MAETTQIMTAKYTPTPELAASMVGLAQAIEEDVRKQTEITSDDVIIQIVGSIIVSFGQSITGEGQTSESTH